jgi:hypothetical protein
MFESLRNRNSNRTICYPSGIKTKSAGSEKKAKTQKRGQVQFYRAAEPGAGAKTRLTEEEEEEEAGLRRLINLRVTSPAPKPVALGSGYGLNEELRAKRRATG